MLATPSTAIGHRIRGTRGARTAFDQRQAGDAQFCAPLPQAVEDVEPVAQLAGQQRLFRAILVALHQLAQQLASLGKQGLHLGLHAPKLHLRGHGGAVRLPGRVGRSWGDYRGPSLLESPRVARGMSRLSRGGWGPTTGSCGAAARRPCWARFAATPPAPAHSVLPSASLLGAGPSGALLPAAAAAAAGAAAAAAAAAAGPAAGLGARTGSTLPSTQMPPM